jgi:alpha-beta hydrolase superfamily lysophospholipase
MEQGGTVMFPKSEYTGPPAAVMSRSFLLCARAIRATIHCRLLLRPTSTPPVGYIATRSPISNTFARYENAVGRLNDGMVKNNKVFFSLWETVHEANPQEILDREEKIALVPFLIMQGALDDNMLPEVQEKFVKSYRAAGGACDYHLFENSVHEWVAEPGPQTNKAREMVKEFIAQQLRT